jgi:4'-phosphopantetheinyl transferase EntD
VVGSITHCAGYRACAAAHERDVRTIGLDAEPHDRLPDGVLGAISSPGERARLAALTAAVPAVCWDRLLFSAKESVYKAWFPLTGRWLGFEEAAVDFDPVQRTFTARLLVEGPVVNGTELTSFEGRWLVSNGLVAAAIVISRGLCVFACGVVLKSTAMSSQLNTGAASQKVDGE